MIRLYWHQIHHIHTPSLQALLARYPTVFKEGLGTLKGYKAKIYVDPDAVPRFNRARSVPYAFKDKVDEELQRLRRASGDHRLGSPNRGGAQERQVYC